MKRIFRGVEAINVTSSSMVRQTVWICAVLLAGCGRGDALAQEGQRTTTREDLGDVPAVVDTSTTASLSRTFRAAAAKALPSVVTVQVTGQPQAQPQNPFGFPFGDRQPRGEAPPQMATGSGFVITGDGHIMTNNHVVENATNIQIRFADGRIYDNVEVVGRDPNSDVAVLRIVSGRDGPFVPLEIGNSDRLQVGDWVLALGNPLNLGFTVTAINRGNSGGPLVDLYGRLVGVNTAIFSPTGAFSGNGFAVPSAIAVKVARDIMEYGYVRRPQLGVRISPV